MIKMISAILIATQLAACATYHSRAVPFRTPTDYGNSLVVSGVSLGAESFADPAAAGETFGFDIRSAGLLPVQVVIDNQSGQGIQIMSRQSFLIDNRGRYWNVLTTREAVQRVDRATSDGAIGSGAGRGAMYGAAAGTILGLALGIVSGGNSGSAALKGGVLGAAGGALIGGASAADNPDHSATVSGDLRDKGIDGKVIPAGALATGFIFFPGEAPGAKSLRLQIRFRSNGQTETVELPFEKGEKPRIIRSLPASAKPADG